MSEQPKPNRGGRPKLSPPQNAAEARALIATEVIRSKPREMMLRGLFRLLNEYKQHEKSPLELRRVALEEETVRQKREALELAKQQAALQTAEYRRRYAATSHGARNLLRTIEHLEAENVALKKQVAELVMELEGRAA